MSQTRQKQPNVASGARPVAETIRQLIEYGLSVIHKDISDPNSQFIVDELFSMWGQETIDKAKQYLKEHTNIPVVMDWPHEGLDLPQVCVVTQSERERETEEFLGDVTGMVGAGAATRFDANHNPIEEVSDNNIVQRQQRGLLVNGTTGVYVRAKDPNLCTLLTHVVRLIIFMNKIALIRDGDIHNLVIGVEAIAHNPELFPEFAYTREIELTYVTQFDYNLPTEIVRRLSLGLLVNPPVIEPSDGSVHDENAVVVPIST